MSTAEKFEQWCVVEIMGHKRFAGFVTEQTVGGVSFVRVDVPYVKRSDGTVYPAFTKLFGAASIYCLSPCTEETARAFASLIRAEGFALYEAPRLEAKIPVPAPSPIPDDYQQSHIVIDEYHELDDDAIDFFAKSLGIEPDSAVLEPDKGFIDPIDNEPF